MYERDRTGTRVIPKNYANLRFSLKLFWDDQRTQFLIEDVGHTRARIDSSDTVAWYLTDHVGSVRHMIDNSGVVQNTIVYDGFGNITSESNASFGDRYKWTGREWDAEAELQYNRARYYDPAIGRWISRDPLGFEAGYSNLYRYVNNQPTNAIDPSGLDTLRILLRQKKLG
ncbi:MAG: RHS repeat-associated core domain-containing protein [Gemmataceae bacterium]